MYQFDTTAAVGRATLVVRLDDQQATDNLSAAKIVLIVHTD